MSDQPPSRRAAGVDVPGEPGSGGAALPPQRPARNRTACAVRDRGVAQRRPCPGQRVRAGWCRGGWGRRRSAVVPDHPPGIPEQEIGDSTAESSSPLADRRRPGLCEPIRSRRRAAGRRGRSTPGFGRGSLPAPRAAPLPPGEPAPTGSRTHAIDPPGEPPKTELRTRRHQVIADPGAEPQELGGHHCETVCTPASSASVSAAAVATEPRHRVGTAGLQLTTQHIACHIPIVPSPGHHRRVDIPTHVSVEDGCGQVVRRRVPRDAPAGLRRGGGHPLKTRRASHSSRSISSRRACP